MAQPLVLPVVMGIGNVSDALPRHQPGCVGSPLCIHIEGIHEDASPAPTYYDISIPFEISSQLPSTGYLARSVYLAQGLLRFRIFT